MANILDPVLLPEVMVTDQMKTDALAYIKNYKPKSVREVAIALGKDRRVLAAVRDALVAEGKISQNQSGFIVK